MADSSPDPGAPIAKDAIDPDLVKLRRPRPTIGVITAAGLVFLSVFFLWRLNPDRRFSGGAETPVRVTAADVVAGKVATDSFISVEAQPMIAQAIRVTPSKGNPGLRVVPARGTGEKLWLALPGDGWTPPTVGPYTGRLRKLGDLPFADALRTYADAHPRPVFATPSAVRAGFASGKVAAISGETLEVKDADRVAFELVAPNDVSVVCAFTDRLPNAGAWATALAGAGLTTAGAPTATTEQAKFEVHGSMAEVTTKLQAGNLFAATVEPVTRHFETTWAELKASSPAGFTIKSTTVPDSEVELLGLYVARGVPSGAYALLTGENPADYWYVLPVTIALAVIALLFTWVLVRAVKRDLLPTRV